MIISLLWGNPSNIHYTSHAIAIAACANVFNGVSHISTPNNVQSLTSGQNAVAASNVFNYASGSQSQTITTCTSHVMTTGGVALIKVRKK